MKQIKQKYEARSFGGFSDARIRFYLLGFMIFGLLMAPILGIIATTITVLIYGIFTAIKLNEFQQNDSESMLRHWQAMDRIYRGSVNADYYQRMLAPYAKSFKKVQIKILGTVLYVAML